MSDERRRELGEEDFGGGDEVREEEMDKVGEYDEFECSAENEVREGEESGEEEGSNSVENGGETVSVSSSNKRIKVMLIDRLSALPDSLIIHILSFLWSLKKSATTSVLSKRWQYIWTELPKLNFRESSTDIEKTRKFVSWVHRTLVLRAGNHLDELEIHFAYDECFASDVNVWVEFAVKNKVKQLTLELHSCIYFFYMLPQVMDSCSSLTTLSVQRCIVAPQRTVVWKSLTILSIEDVELDEHIIRKILSGCPVLRSLGLRACWGFECLDIDSQSLHNLSISDCEDEVTGPLLEISAPYIRSLNISMFPIDRKRLRLTNTPSLIRADIHFNLFGWNGISEEEMNGTMEFFEDIKHVKELFLSCQCIEVLSKLAENGRQLPQSTRECLTVEAYRNEDSISGIVVLLESSPILETLNIECPDSYEESDETWGPVVRSDLGRDLLHLKTVKLMDCADPNLNGEPMLTMAQILLKRATALEKMVVTRDRHKKQ